MVGVERSRYVHSLPGRIRLRVPGLPKNSAMADRIRNLASRPGYQRLQINTLTGSVLIFYNQAETDPGQIILDVDERRKCCLPPAPVSRPVPRWTVKDQKNFLILVGGSLGFLALKQGIWGRSPLSKSRALTDTGIFLSLVTGYPFFDRFLQRFQAETRFSVHLLIRYASYLLLVLQESTGGLLITLLIQLTRFIALKNLANSRRAIERMGVLPQKVWTIVNGKEIFLPADHLRRGNTVVVHAGETITVDGLVASGQADVDESRVTGFTEPVRIGAGDDVLAGSEVRAGAIKISVEKTGGETFLSQIIQYVKAVDEREESTLGYGQEAIARLSALALILAGLAAAGAGNLRRSLAILLAGLPSAASLAVPASLGLAVGGAAQRGIFVKDADSLLAAGGIETAVFDKTGTLTSGKASVEDVAVTDRKYRPEDIVRMAMLVERSSSHPVTAAVRTKAAELHVGPPANPEQVEVKPGYGVEAKIHQQIVMVGNRQLMESKEISSAKARTKAQRYQQLGLTPVFVAVDNRLAGLFAVREHFARGAQETVQKLRTLGIEHFMLLTGDTQEAAETAATWLGIETSRGWLGPEQKADWIQNLKRQGGHVAMIGDGVDDGPAMARSDVGISLGRKGGDSAARVADVILASRDPQAVVKAVYFAQKTREVTKQNLYFSLGLNALGLGLAAGGLLGPVRAAALGGVGTLAVLFNAAGLRK